MVGQRLATPGSMGSWPLNLLTPPRSSTCGRTNAQFASTMSARRSPTPRLLGSQRGRRSCATSVPTLSVFTPRLGVANGVGVIVVPGGGWTINAWDHEGLEVARWLAGVGYTAFLLKYRVQASPPDQAEFEALMAAMDAALATPRTAAQLRAPSVTCSPPTPTCRRGPPQPMTGAGRSRSLESRRHALGFVPTPSARSASPPGHSSRSTWRSIPEAPRLPSSGRSTAGRPAVRPCRPTLRPCSR